MRIVVVLVLVLGLVGACASEKLKANESPQSAAEVFLSLIDEGNYEQSWVASSDWLRNNINASQWEEHVGRFRQPLGTVDHREFRSIEFDDSLEDMPAGSYAFAYFDTTLADQRSASEMVGLVLEDDSTWRVIGYQTL